MKDVLAAILQAASEPESTVHLTELGAVLAADGQIGPPASGLTS